MGVSKRKRRRGRKRGREWKKDRERELEGRIERVCKRGGGGEKEGKESVGEEGKVGKEERGRGGACVLLFSLVRVIRQCMRFSASCVSRHFKFSSQFFYSNETLKPVLLLLAVVIELKPKY
jgi:hypothetical protein